MSDSVEHTYRALLDAVAFAARAHEGQVRKDKRTPYVSHVFRVCLILRDIFGVADPRALQTALLHDTLEDTTTDFDDLAETFGTEVAEWVSILSKDKRLQEGPREEAYIAGLQRAPWQVKACKLADMFDNLMDAAHLPAERRPKTLARIDCYWQALSQHPPPEIEKPLDLVGKLYEELARPSDGIPDHSALQ